MIRNKKQFRAAFASSPCIWAEDANLKVLRWGVGKRVQERADIGKLNGDIEVDCVLLERLDQYVVFL